MSNYLICILPDYIDIYNEEELNELSSKIEAALIRTRCIRRIDKIWFLTFILTYIGNTVLLKDTLEICLENKYIKYILTKLSNEFYTNAIDASNYYISNDEIDHHNNFTRR